MSIAPGLVTSNHPNSPYYKRPTGQTLVSFSRTGNAKLNEEQVREMRALHAEGTSFYALAKRYGVTQETIRGACLRLTWKHVP